MLPIDLRLSYVGRLGPRGNRESVYQFVETDDRRVSIFEKWLNRELVSATNNIDIPTQVTDTTSSLTSHNSELVSVTNNIDIQIPITDTLDIPQTLNEAVGGWKGLRLKLRQGLHNAGRFYTELVSSFGEAIGVADGEPFWNEYLGNWMVGVKFADGCKSVVCDWLECVG
ncbi:hypothetical protein A6770_41435 [Nostoc minutum NIES-26]|uniref:Uncharacterized protein n=1 Tax=Nostoc minutum NIES-26 TaxID=1844469 RepID=A0A367R429_9NOSO|nr:hypothetical protein A6770_41435 [Nostoc minutum NIES-26]